MAAGVGVGVGVGIGVGERVVIGGAVAMGVVLGGRGGGGVVGRGGSGGGGVVEVGSARSMQMQSEVEVPRAISVRSFGNSTNGGVGGTQRDSTSGGQGMVAVTENGSPRILLAHYMARKADEHVVQSESGGGRGGGGGEGEGKIATSLLQRPFSAPQQRGQTLSLSLLMRRQQQEQKQVLYVCLLICYMYAC